MEPWSDRLAASVKTWSDEIAALVVDALVDAGLVDRNNFQRAFAIVSEEVFARLCVRDYPPRGESELPGSDT
jgi:hypothetical protein